MALSPDQAQEALRDIAATERRSFEAYGYKAAAPFLILWGLIWIAGYAVSDFAPLLSGKVWLALAVIGSLGSFIIGGRQKGGGKTVRFDWRIAFTWLTGIVFFTALFAIMAPVDGRQMGAIFPLFIGTSYVVLGIWIGMRFVLAGLLIAALTLIGFYYVDQHFALWMAVLGGGTLTATGLWLRSA
ncbi:MAG: hypothetical protein GC166_03390 [Alphaproteobacteria bacterium]|nr:hypothetical protein [Alphaproteobacteria bacterium]